MCVGLCEGGCVHVFVPLSAASQAMGRQGRDQFQLRTTFLCVCKCIGQYVYLCVLWVFVCAQEMRWTRRLVFLTGAASHLLHYSFIHEIPAWKPCYDCRMYQGKKPTDNNACLGSIYQGDFFFSPLLLIPLELSEREQKNKKTHTKKKGRE